MLRRLYMFTIFCLDMDIDSMALELWVELECQVKWAEWVFIGSMVFILCDGANVDGELIASLPCACWSLVLP